MGCLIFSKLATIHNEEKIAVGTELGVFFKSTDRDGSIRKVLSSENVTQLAVLENFHILLVLSGKSDESREIVNNLLTKTI